MSDSIPDNTSTTTSVSVNNSMYGTIDTSGDVDWFRASLQAGTTYQIDLQGSESGWGTLADPNLLGVYGSSGTLISGTRNDDFGTTLDSRVEFTPVSTGTYYVSAGGYGNETGSYRLSVTGEEAGDDFGDTTTSAGNLSIGGTVNGDIEVPDDRDWFRVSLQAGVQYQIDLEGSATSQGTLADTYLRGIYNSTGQLLPGTADDDGGVSYNSQLAFTPSATGFYYIAAGAFGTNTGTYRVGVSATGPSDDFGESMSSAGNLTLGGTVSGNIETANDNDWFAVNLQAGRSYRIDMEGSATFGPALADTYLRGVYSNSGLLISDTSNDDFGGTTNSRVEFTPASSGTHYISAGAYSSNTGGYRLSITDLGGGDDYGTSAPTAGSINVGGTAIGTIEEAGDQDWFAITLQAGRTYQIDLEGSPTSTSTLNDTFLRGIYNSNGSLIANTTDDDGGASFNSSLQFAPTSSGVHYISAGAFGAGTGTYRVSVADLGGTDDFGSTTSTAGSATAGSPENGNIESAGDVDWFAISLAGGRVYTIDLEGSPTSAGTLSDTYLRGIHDSGGRLIANTTDDDGGTDYNSQLAFSPSSSGTYYIAAGAYGSNTGTYKLVVTDSNVSQDDFGSTSSTAGTVSLDSHTRGVIEEAGDTDWFGISLQAGMTYHINLEGSPTSEGTLADTFLRGVYNASGVLTPDTANDDGGSERNSFLELTPDVTGQYFIAAGAYGLNTGTYKLSVDQVGGGSSGGGTPNDDFGQTTTTAGTLTLGTLRSATLEQANDRDWFAITLQAGRTYQVDLEGSPTSRGTLDDPYIYGIHNSAGVVQSGTTDDDGGTGVNSLLRFTPPSSGTYYIEAGAYGNDTGSYSLTVNESGPTGGTGGSGGSPGGTAGEYDIQINYDGDTRYQSYFETAAHRWEEIIIGDVPDINTQWGRIDDLEINASVQHIDGPGGTLARAGADAVRSDSYIAVHGVMHFDSADLASMEEKGTLGDVILHEMGHVLGINSRTFTELGLASGTQYTGANALADYRALTGNSSASFVPLEGGGGRGTALSHWDEDVFTRELMTGYAEDSPPMPLSRLTIAALQDVGYTVNYNTADPYNMGQRLVSGQLTSQSSLVARDDGMAAVQASHSLHNALPASFTGSSFLYTGFKPLRLVTGDSAEKLDGNVTTASESHIYLMESTSGTNFLVRLDGEFEKNNPETPNDIKGVVTSISFYGGISPVPEISLTYTSAQSVGDVVDNWNRNFLAQDNYIESDTLDPQNDYIEAGAGNDIIAAGPGDDVIAGGSGLDTAVFHGDLADFSISRSAGQIDVLGSAVEGNDVLYDVERLRFDDLSLAFDLDGNAGLVAELLGALLGQDNWYNREYVGIGLDLLDNAGLTYEQLMSLALEEVLGPNASHGEVVDLLYTNVVGVRPSEAQYNEFVGLLETGEFTQVSLGVAAAQHELNIENIGLVGVADTGLEYLSAI